MKSGLSQADDLPSSGLCQFPERGIRINGNGVADLLEQRNIIV
jgi:hypothetical protein